MSHSRAARRGVAAASTLGVLVTPGSAAAPSASASVASPSWGSTSNPGNLGPGRHADRQRPGYTATPGYDEVTGIGTLDIAALNSVIAGS